MKILYLTWGERVSSSGLYKSQVLNLCVALAKKGGSVDLCSFIPIGNRDVVKGVGQYRANIRNTVAYAKSQGVTLVANHYFGSSFENYTPWYLWPLIYAPWNLSVLKQLIIRERYDVIHCRSYHAANAAFQAMDQLKIDIPLIFDPRGHMPEEGVLHRRYSRSGFSYSRWKSVEKSLCQKAAVTVAVSTPMKRYFESLGSKDVRLIYISSDMNAASESPVSSASEVSEKQLIYIGAVGSWHTIDGVFDIFKSFGKKFPQATLRILTDQSSWQRIHQVAIEKSIGASSYSLGYVNSRADLKQELERSYAGLLTYRTPQNPVEDLIASTLLSTKFVEYLTSGIPVIANKHCGGASEYIKSHNCGVPYDPENLDDAPFSMLESFWSDVGKRNKVMQEAVQDFSVDLNASRYFSLYQSLLGNTPAIDFVFSNARK